MSKKLSKEKIEQIFVLYEEMNSMNDVAKALNVSKGVVHKVLNNEQRSHEHERLVNDYKKIREESNNNLIEIMQSNTVDKVVKLAIGKLTSKNMDKDIERGGLGNMYRLVGMFTDKVLSIKDHEIKLKQLSIREKELAIKEKELELRISNPESFATVNIVNDAPKDDKYGIAHI